MAFHGMHFNAKRKTNPHKLVTKCTFLKKFTFRKKFAEDFYLALPPAGADFQPKEKADEKGKYCYESKA